MTDDTSTGQRRRRRSRSNTQRCNRPGCHRHRTVEYEFCSSMCRLLDLSVERARRVAQAVGGTEASNLYAEAVSMSDSWTEMLKLEAHIRKAALEVGITPAQWHSITLGESQTGG